MASDSKDDSNSTTTSDEYPTQFKTFTQDERDSYGETGEAVDSTLISDLRARFKK